MTKLTKAQIDSAQTEGRDLFIWDGALPGFGIRVKSSGIKSFVVQYRNRSGRSRRQTIGRYGRLTLDEARRLARKELARVAHGSDPRQERIQKRQSATVAELAECYLTEYCPGRNKPSTIKANEWLLEKFIIPKLGRLTLDELTEDEVRSFHRSLRKTPYNANRARGLLSAMCGQAHTFNFRDKGWNPVSEVEPYKEVRRQRYLTIEELKRLAQALDEEERAGLISPFVIAAIRLLILLGARRDEVRKMKWRLVDLERQVVIIDDHKTDDTGPKVLPLNEAAVNILRSLPRDPSNPHVIQGSIPGQPYADLEKPWRKIRKRAGLDRVRLHDLRHSFASFSVSIGVPLRTVGGLLGQESLQATMRYAHLPDDPRRTASESVGNVIAGHLLTATVSLEAASQRLADWRERVSKSKQARLKSRKPRHSRAMMAAE